MVCLGKLVVQRIGFKVYVFKRKFYRRNFILKNVPKIVSPELLKTLCEMGHGDEIVISDGNFPAETFGKRVIRADGIVGAAKLRITVFPKIHKD